VIRSEQASDYREHFAGDPDPLDLLPDVLELRVRIADFCNRYDEATDALLAWHSSFGPGWQQASQSWREDYDDWISEFMEVAEMTDAVRDSKLSRARELVDPPPPPSPQDFADRPRKIVDILQAGQFIVQTGKLVELIQKRDQERGLSLLELSEILKRHGVELVAAVNELIEDHELRTKLLTAVSDRWDTIPVAVDRGRKAT
jgi:hypothetical protein